MQINTKKKKGGGIKLIIGFNGLRKVTQTMMKTEMRMGEPL